MPYRAVVSKPKGTLDSPRPNRSDSLDTFQDILWGLSGGRDSHVACVILLGIMPREGRGELEFGKGGEV